MSLKKSKYVKNKAPQNMQTIYYNIYLSQSNILVNYLSKFLQLLSEWIYLKIKNNWKITEICYKKIGNVTYNFLDSRAPLKSQNHVFRVLGTPRYRYPKR